MIICWPVYKPFFENISIFKMKIKNTFLEKQWTKIREQISKLRQVPLAQKILFYKVFIRPLLIFNWIKGCANDLKAIEAETLKQIFGDERQRNVYRHYSDIDISCYLKLQESRWSRWNSLCPNFMKTMFHATKNSVDPCPYFIRALTVPKARATLRQRRTRLQRRRFLRPSTPPDSDDTLDSESFVNSLIDATFCSEESFRPRRSLRIANKKRRS